MTKVIKLKEIINKTQESINDEIDKHNNGIGTVSNLKQLENIKNILLKIQDEINNDKLSFTNFGLGRMIVDSWPFDSILGQNIIKIEQNYLSLKNS